MSSSADVAALIAKAKAERKADQPTFTQRILQFAPYTASLEYRAAVGPAAVHEKEAEMFYVIEGTGEVRIGNETFPIRAGDIIACPTGGQDTAHQIVNTGKTELRYLAVSTTLLYGYGSHCPAAGYLRSCRPVARTTTFLIFDFTRDLSEPPPSLK